MVRKKKPSGRKIGKPRPIRDLKRRPGNKAPDKVIVIVCEGKKTEPMYFNAMRRKFRISSLSVKIIPEQGIPISVVNKAIDEKKCVSKGDEVWCVFDFEQRGRNATLPAAMDKARREKLQLAITNPAFEYWYLLHYECTDRPFMNADKVIEQLKAHLPNYDKKDSVYEDIGDKTSDALKNTGKLRANAECPWENCPNSSTGVDKLVIEILKMA